MRLLKIRQTDFMGTQTVLVGDLETARHYLHAWFLASRNMSNYLGKIYGPIEHTVHMIDTSIENGVEREWQGVAEEKIHEAPDGLTIAFYLFPKSRTEDVRRVLNRFKIKPELKQSHIHSAKFPEGLLGLCIAYESGADMELPQELFHLAEYVQNDAWKMPRKNNTAYQHPLDREIGHNCDCVRWPGYLAMHNNYLIFEQDLDN